jgi:hypothetical protein
VSIIEGAERIQIMFMTDFAVLSYFPSDIVVYSMQKPFGISSGMVNLIVEI